MGGELGGEHCEVLWQKGTQATEVDGTLPALATLLLLCSAPGPRCPNTIGPVNLSAAMPWGCLAFGFWFQVLAPLWHPELQGPLCASAVVSGGSGSPPSTGGGSCARPMAVPTALGKRHFLGHCTSVLGWGGQGALSGLHRTPAPWQVERGSSEKFVLRSGADRQLIWFNPLETLLRK